jgi:hypothetical protein
MQIYLSIQYIIAIYDTHLKLKCFLVSCLIITHRTFRFLAMYRSSSMFATSLSVSMPFSSLNALHRGKLSSRYTLEACSFYQNILFYLPLGLNIKYFENRFQLKAVKFNYTQVFVHAPHAAAQKMRVLLTRLRLDRAQTEDDNFLCPHINKSPAHAQIRL